MTFLRSTSVRPGDRVGDAYDVCGQVVKSILWMSKPLDLVNQIERRYDEGKGSPFVKGGMVEVQKLLGDPERPVHFHIVLVQPGLDTGLTTTADVLAAADDYVQRAISTPMMVIASKQPSKRPKDWTADKKLKVVLEAAALSEDEMAAFLTRHKLRPKQLEQWRKQILVDLEAPRGPTGALP